MLCQKGGYRVGKAILKYGECGAFLTVLFGNGNNVVRAVEKDGIFVVARKVCAVVKSPVKNSAVGSDKEFVLVAKEPQFHRVGWHKVKSRS